MMANKPLSAALSQSQENLEPELKLIVYSTFEAAFVRNPNHNVYINPLAEVRSKTIFAKIAAREGVTARTKSLMEFSKEI